MQPISGPKYSNYCSLLLSCLIDWIKEFFSPETISTINYLSPLLDPFLPMFYDLYLIIQGPKT